jgi:hypothetical protein
MAAWCMDGKPRTARRFTVYKNCPLPTPEDRLLFILTYLKTYTLQVVHGRLFGMVGYPFNAGHCVASITYRQGPMALPRPGQVIDVR